MELFLQGKIVVTTGAARGIGRAVARGFAQEGAKVLLVDRDERVDAFAAELGGHAVICDMSERGAVDMIVERAEYLGGCDVLINNAGISMPSGFGEISDEDWQAIMGINVDAAFRLMRGLWLQLVNKSGAVVNIASFASQRATLFGGNASYVISKHGLAGLTRAAAMDGAPLGVRVNAVAPGVMDADLGKLQDAAAGGRVQGAISPGRQAQPAEIADVVVFLASKRASHVSGEVMNVNGGLMLD